MFMNRFHFAALAFLAVVGISSCQDEGTVVRTETIPYDSSAARHADSTLPGIHSDSLTAGANDWLLVPGESAGHTHIGSDLAVLQKELGRADAGDAAMQKSVSVWYTDHDTTNNSLTVYATRDAGNSEAAVIRQIRVTSPRYETVRGIRVGTPESNIRASYKVKDVEQFRGKDGTQSKVLECAEGIAFEIGADGICDAIVIHAEGTDRYGSYLKLRF